jgi:hypothetical protein
VASLAIPDLEISCWRQNYYSFDFLAEISAKMVNVSGEEITHLSLNCG